MKRHERLLHFGALGSLLCVLAVPTDVRAETRELAASVYADKVYGNWLGQCAGNYYGLVFENRFIEEPPQDLPREITGWTLESLKKNDGAFSDDDTDIEYMYVHLMEEKGVEPTYADIAKRWERHVNRQIWVANYEARSLMSRGFLPPDTGRTGLNPHWFQIDAQLINEIWAVTAPGMVDYATAKSDWAARVTNDDLGTHPTIWYGAMFSAAFFEPDMRKLYDIGLSHVPPGRFRDALILVRRMHGEGRPWRETRALLKELYYDQNPDGDETRPSASLKSIVNSTVNGAMGALALLYGEGDFEDTLYLSCMAGFDCDNQAATLSGLFGIARGSSVFPRKYLYPVDGWEKPFNDRYVVVSREYLPNVSLTELAERTVHLGEQVIRRNGGKIRMDANGERVYEIDSNASFVPPVEIRRTPVDSIRCGEPCRLEFYAIGGKRDRDVLGEFSGYESGTRSCVAIQNASGQVPGLEFSTLPENSPAENYASWADGRPQKIVLQGTPTEPGEYELSFDVAGDGPEHDPYQVSTSLRVLGKNLAHEAVGVIAFPSETAKGDSQDKEVLRDKRRSGASYTRQAVAGGEEPHWYGYEWAEPQQISQLIYTAGNAPQPFSEGGYWTSFNVEYQEADGQWHPVEDLKIDPDVLIRWSWPYRPYTIDFRPIQTKAIRIIGDAGGEPRATSVAELEVYSAADVRSKPKSAAAK